MALVPPYIASLRPYEAGRGIDEIKRLYGLSRVVKLASNENPLGPSPRAVKAIQKELAGLNRYSPGGLELRRALAARFDTRLDNVIAGSGSEGILSNIIRTFLCDDDEVLTLDATFIGFRVIAQSRGVAYRTVPHRDYSFDLEALAAAITEKTKIIYLANPNNPTGTIFTRAEFEAFYQRVPARVLIILDEAYLEYVRPEVSYPDSMTYRLDNVITLRTFSKIHGLAGVRVGYGFAHEDLIDNLLKVKLAFEPSTLAQAAGIAALEDRDFVTRSFQLNQSTLAKLTAGLRAMGLTVLPSNANFVMLDMGTRKAADSFVNSLLECGVIIRPLAAFGLPHCVRISTGTEEEIEFCLEAVSQIGDRKAELVLR